MREFFKEMVLSYRQADRDAWSADLGPANRLLLPLSAFKLDPLGVQMFERPPAYHFGECQAFQHFHDAEGWLGYRFHVLAYSDDLANPRFTACAFATSRDGAASAA